MVKANWALSLAAWGASGTSCMDFNEKKQINSATKEINSATCEICHNEASVLALGLGCWLLHGLHGLALVNPRCHKLW